MNSLLDYQIIETLQITEHRIVYRGLKQPKQIPVIIKTLKSKYPSLAEITNLKNEYKIAVDLDVAGVIKTHSLEKYGNGLALIIEDIGGISLKQFLSKSVLHIKEFLKIAISLAQTLSQLHKNGIIHKDIKPSNIIINSETKQVKISDFSLATNLAREIPLGIEGSLAYISPEQTGRMNRAIDYRSDFYCLGVTFYEMLTHKLPFVSSDPLELIHHHIAVIPTPPDQINTKVTPAISAIIMKLLAKNAEDRYQSGEGIKADLEICLESMLTGYSSNVSFQSQFIPGKLDKASQFLIPQKLYGRAQEVAKLLSTFEKVSVGQSEIILVSGYSGIGKTSVINEINEPILRQRGYFISGKFDQFRRNIPYAGIIQAFQSLIQQLLTQTKDKINLWREKLLASLGDNGQILIDVIPEVELIIGSQPALPELGLTESQNRFRRVLKEFIYVFTQQEHPLVIFLDDLQWADSASLKLIELLMSDPESKYLLLIGAYRDNEVTATHPLIQTLENIHYFSEITLQPLGLQQVQKLVDDTLNQSTLESRSLAELLFNKTGGNPFFLTQLLQTLHSEKLITFDFHTGCWQWNLQKIQALGITDYNVVELVARSLQQLPEVTQQVLKLAACIGNQFSLDILAVISEKSKSETAADLWFALQAGLILPLDDTYKVPLILATEESEKLPKITYKFLHDRVQQAAYSLIPTAEKHQTHQRIGQLLLSHTPPEELEEKIFVLVNQLNVGWELLNDPKLKIELARLNLIAGKKAKAATAYEVAVKYLQFGKDLLPETSWEDNYDLTLDYYSDLAEAEYLNTNFTQANAYADIIVKQATSLLEQVKVYELKMQMHIAQLQMSEAIEMGLQVLKKLDIYLEQEISRQIIVEDLINLPVMKEASKIVAMNCLMQLVSPVYVTQPKLLPEIVFTMINLSIKYGNCPASAFAYIIYADILCGPLLDIETGYRYGELAVKVLDKFAAKPLQAKVLDSLYGQVLHWKKHLGETIEPLQLAIQSGLETGDLVFTGYCTIKYSTHLFFCGKPLEYVIERAKKYTELTQKIKQEYPTIYQQICLQMALNLQGKSHDRLKLVGDFFDETEAIPIFIKDKNATTLFFTYLAKTIIFYLFKEPEKALVTSKEAQKYIDSCPGLICVSEYIFYSSLVLLALYPQASIIQQQEYLNQVFKNQELLKYWADCAPMNYQHKYDLVAAEIARLTDNKELAAELYDQAIRGAKESHYLQEQALANELAAEFYISCHRDKLAQMYLTDAYYDYLRWEARAKSLDLRSRHPNFLYQLTQEENWKTNGVINFNQVSTTSKSNPNSLDLNSVIKASQALSGEIELDNLLHKLMKTMLESAGAQKGLLILLSHKENNSNRDNWLLVAEGIVESELRVKQPFIPLTETLDMPLSLINYIQRTQEAVVLNQATTEGLFTHDCYILKHKPQSLLGFPIIYQGKLNGILYLEHRLLPGAFTHDRLEVLSLLSTQAAISLENALLYNSLEEKVAARTQELNEKNLRLEQTLEQLQQTQLQLIQSEKMSSLGQLVAGIAHEINNPVNFIYANLSYTDDYTKDLFEIIALYQKCYPETAPEIKKKMETIDWAFVTTDLPKILNSMKVGTERIKEIVLSLRNFSRLDESEMKFVNLHEGIDNTLLILENRLKGKPSSPRIEIIKDYAQLPMVECYAAAMNQVFASIIHNAIDVLEESSREQPQIHIRSELVDKKFVSITIRDNGFGISKDVIKRIFDPFFTTKPVGQGTGMGMAISYQIVVKRHGGKLTCNSTIGQGSEFIIQIPIKQQSKKVKLRQSNLSYDLETNAQEPFSIIAKEAEICELIAHQLE